MQFAEVRVCAAPWYEGREVRLERNYCSWSWVSSQNTSSAKRCTQVSPQKAQSKLQYYIWAIVHNFLQRPKIFLLLPKILNQIFHTRCNTPKRVTSLRGPSPVFAPGQHSSFRRKCRSGGEPLATLRSIWPARDLNLKPPAPETNALPLNQLTFWFDLVENLDR